ncbi:MAG: hypothetical protein B7Z66_05090 [Chromatiales bacterium 21-64-14]|nr:MAG: hypothetical protein B7Z66_05090 [Chromatiales bacterium 21-64-14]HQU16478.1 TIGR04219 family outer membrane beta-barrel protein [Gammaproteobacteria bacterium]
MGRHWKYIAALVSLGLGSALVSIAAAATPSVWVGAGGWNHDPRGTVQYQGDTLDLNRDLGLGRRTAAFAWLTLESPIPLLPNLRLVYTNASTGGASTLSRDLTFGGTTFTTSENIASQAALDQYDAVLYYSLLRTWMQVDLGVDVKYLNGDVQVQSGTQFERTRVSGAVPMLYANAVIPLPIPGTSVGANASYTRYAGSRLLDYTLKGAYESRLGLGAEIGWRGQKIRLNGFQNVNADITWRGPYAGMFYHF